MLRKLKERWEQLDYEVFLAENKESAKEIVKSLIKKDESISLGGSVTLDQLELVKTFRDEGFNLYDRYAELTDAERTECFKRGLTADWLVMSSNAITEKGEIINVDGTGNRVAPLIYGTQNVLIIVGKNKVVSDVSAAAAHITAHSTGHSEAIISEDENAVNTFLSRSVKYDKQTGNLTIENVELTINE